MTDTDAPEFTPEMIRGLIRGRLTVVKPGETILMRPDRNITQNQLRELQDWLNRWHYDGDLPFRVIALPGEEFARAGESGDEKLTFEFEGKPWTGTPLVNGHRVLTAESFDVHVSCGEAAAVTLKLIAPDGLRLALDGAMAGVGDETREALVSLGWTPPEASA